MVKIQRQTCKNDSNWHGIYTTIVSTSKVNDFNNENEKVHVKAYTQISLIKLLTECRKTFTWLRVSRVFY